MKALKTVLLISVIFAFACKGGIGSGKGPGDVYKDAMNKIADGEYEAVMEMMAIEEGTEATAEELEKTMGILGMVNAMIQAKGGLKSIDIINEEISEDGNSAKIEYKLNFGNGETSEEDSNLVKIDGQWKLQGL